MADPKQQLNPVTINFVDTSPAVSQPVPVSSANPLPVTLTGGATDQDVNLVGINGAAPAVGHGVAATALRVELPTDGTGVIAGITNPVAASQSGTWDIGPYSYSRKTADGQVKATAGYIHTVTFSPTGAVTAGVCTIYDSAAESGTVVLSVSLPVTTFTPFTVQIDATMGIGIYVGFDGTLANVQVTVSYR